MLNWSIKEDMLTIIGMLILFVLLVWFMVTQPTFTSQSSHSQMKYVKAENLKEHVYTHC